MSSSDRSSLSHAQGNGSNSSHGRCIWCVTSALLRVFYGAELFIVGVAKPQSISSAQVIRDLQRSFNPSKYFAPWLHAERDKMRRSNTKEKRIRQLQVKLGHGGTLDPMATGVLILGVGSGTKALPNFLKCTKTYETTVLFGAATDSYDSKGKILAKAPFSHITKLRVQEALEQFRGQIQQKPPIFSALKMDGKKLYEYARAGKEIPKEIETRSMTVSSIELMEWHSGGNHEYRFPTEEVVKSEEASPKTVIQLSGITNTTSEDFETAIHPTVLGKRKAADDGGVVIQAPNVRVGQSKMPQPLMSGALGDLSEVGDESSEAKDLILDPVDESVKAEAAPAAKIRMTVSSGFYVRSFCNDLGKAVGSLAHMVQLSRTKQGDFELGKNVLEHFELTSDEAAWAPKLEASLAAWQQGLFRDIRGNI